MTSAQQGFMDARPEIDELLRTARSLGDTVQDGRRMSPQENQARHVIVSLVAILQAYVTDLLEETADRLGDQWDGLSDVERRYVAVQTNRRIEAFMESCSEASLANPQKIDSLRTVVLDCAEWCNKPSALARSAYRENLGGFLQDNGSKALDRIISRYGRCGMSFFSWLNKYHVRYRSIEDTLNVVIDTRNDVAHGTFRRRVTVRDVRVYRVLVYRMIGKIQDYIDEPAPETSASA